MTTVAVCMGFVVGTVFLLVVLNIARRPYLLEVHLREGSTDESWHPFAEVSDAQLTAQRRVHQELERR